MLESRFHARRAGALAAAAPTSRPGVDVRPLPGGARFSLRVRPNAADALFGLDLPVNRLWTAGERFSARLGPDEWLVGGPEADAELLREETERALHGRFHALVDVSHRSVAIEIAGPLAAEALNAGCPLDLFDEAFPGGSATRTLLGKSEIVLIRPTDAPTWRVECWRSFAVYVHGFLVEAAGSAGA
ncbi:sarcosine oxidase subunit gamma [Hansschlegelia sp. KR7-227]|uniref:sarcosine oxidase subunit gamma n=1 Tax=Hansschlegelia sp. KR7-227 TaxID=3400914 RepID=UPI003C0F8B10